jgi:hypothetical protein
MDQSKKESKSQKGAPPLEKARTTDKKRERERERKREKKKKSSRSVYFLSS